MNPFFILIIEFNKSNIVWFVTFQTQWQVIIIICWKDIHYYNTNQ